METVNSAASFFPLMSGLRKLGSVSMWAGLIGTAIFFLRTGRTIAPATKKKQTRIKGSLG